MAVLTGGADESATEGFPAVPDFAPLAPGAEPSHAVDRCLGTLDRQPVSRFGAELMASVARDVAELRATLRPLGLVEEAALLGKFDTALASFAFEGDAGRRRRTAAEWLKGRDAPILFFLERLEVLVRDVPEFSGRRPAEWDRLSAIYGRALAGIAGLADHIRAGQIRIGELSARMEARDANAPLPEQDGQLRAKRDAVERRTHLLRIVRTRIAEYLVEVRKAAAVRAAFSAELQMLATRAMPAWEAILLAVAEEAQDNGQGRHSIDLSPVDEANATLRGDIRRALDAAAALREACGTAEGCDPGEIADIERRVMGPGRKDGAGSEAEA